ncbi:natriuretic peptides B [Castor canadensis]|uniref:Natriuretic peptides B n=1 Tax=Castor canadensis TaxID=51338 RepID=A0AC58MXE7_CASCN
MGSQMVLPRTLLLLLFLNLLPLGGHSHPLSTSQELELSEIQEVLDRLQDKVEELQVETMALEPLQDQGPAEAQETGKAVPKSNLGSRDNAFQALQGLQNPKMARSSGCFGRRMDRIGSFSSLGCNVLRRN